MVRRRTADQTRSVTGYTFFWAINSGSWYARLFRRIGLAIGATKYAGSESLCQIVAFQGSAVLAKASQTVPGVELAFSDQQDAEATLFEICDQSIQ